MPIYIYKAKSLDGKEKAGEIEAKDTHQLAQILREDNFILLKADIVEKKEDKKSLKIFSGGLPFLNGVGLADKMFFTRNLEVMISAGAPLPKALGTLAIQAKSKKFKNALLEIQEQIAKGNSFSECLSKYPDIFSDLFRSMIKVAEESGTLDEVLKTLAVQLEKENELKGKIKGAMVYPSVIVCAMVIIGIVMMVTVVPQLAQTFNDLDVELPATTQFLIALANLFQTKLHFIVLGIFLFIIAFMRALKTPAGKKFMDTFLLKAPLISPIVKKTNAATTIRNLSSLITAGVPLLQGLDIIKGTLGNSYYKAALVAAAERVKKGEKLSEALKPYTNIYPLTVIQMIEVGEETGETAKVLSRLAEFYEEEVANATASISSIIEPILMIIIGIAVGFFAISMVQPMYSMADAI